MNIVLNFGIYSQTWALTIPESLNDRDHTRLISCNPLPWLYTPRSNHGSGEYMGAYPPRRCMWYRYITKIPQAAIVQGLLLFNITMEKVGPGTRLIHVV